MKHIAKHLKGMTDKLKEDMKDGRLHLATPHTTALQKAKEAKDKYYKKNMKHLAAQEAHGRRYDNENPATRHD